MNKPFEARRVADLNVSTVASQPSVIDAAALISKAYNFHNHPYFTWVCDPNTTLEEYRATQIPFRYAIENFSRSMSAVLAQIPRMEDRMEVYENVAEEHGEGKLEDSHRDSFMGFLRAIGVQQDEIDIECPIRIAGFYEGLLNYALTKPQEVSAGLMGTIEYLHCNIAELQARALHDRFWGDYEAQYHYRLHKEIDVGHAKDLFESCEEGWETGGELTRNRIAYAMLLAAHYLWHLFDDMCPVTIIKPSAVDPTTSFTANKEIENSARIDCNIDIEFDIASTAYLGHATLIGLHGVFVKTEAKASIDTPVGKLVIDLNDGSEPLELAGIVRANTTTEQSNTMVIEFIFDSEDKRNSLRTTLNELTMGEETTAA